MVLKLERWVAEARGNSFPEKEVRIIERAKERLKKAGMPGEFTQEISKSPRLEAQDHTSEPLTDASEIRSRMIEALSSVLPGKDLTRRMADEVNFKVGQFLDDSVLLNDLELIWNSSHRVNLSVKGNYTRLLNSLRRGRYSRVGEIRNADLGEMERILLTKISNSSATLRFGKTAFARPQAGK